VELHDGSIRVISSPGEGSEFVIELPVRLVEDRSEIIETQRLTAQANIEKIDIEFSDIY
jgi:chemotaxis protein histidine kinase CheA